MWWFLLGIIFLDGLLVYLFPSYLNDISIFYPMLTVSLISLLYSYYPVKKFYKMCFAIGIVYDLLYSSIFLYNALLFLLLGKIDSKIYKTFKDNLFLKLVITIINIIIYDTIGFILVKISSYSIIGFDSLIYKISHSLLLNILFVFVVFFFFKKSFSRHRM